MGKSWKKAGILANAAKKGAQFTKLAREIAVAAKMGGPDPEGNARLKMAVKAALAVSCPKATIERAIKKGSGQLDDGTIIEEVSYEGMGPHNVGIIVGCQTDNRNRTVGEIRNIFKKNGGQLGDMGSAAWQFDRVSIVSGKKENVADAEEDAIEVGANEVEFDAEEKLYTFYGEPDDLDAIQMGLTGRGFEIEEAEIGFKAKNPTQLEGDALAEVEKLLEALDDNEDSHRIYTTLD